MEESKKIKEFSFQYILEIAKASLNKNWVYEDKIIVFSFGESPSDINNMAFLKYPTRIEATFMLVCSEIHGESVISCDLQEYTLKSNSMFFSRAGAILQAKTFSSGKGWGIIFDPSYSSNMNVSLQNILPHYSQLKQEQTFALSSAKVELLSGILNLMAKMIEDKDSAYYHDIIKSQASIFTYEFLSILTDLVNQNGLPEKRANREELYFKQFMQLLSEHHIRERAVAFYADQMSLSAKYLSSIVKKVTNKTPSEWIDGMVIVEAKNLLKYSEMNVQQIAYHLNFPNQSFFGKYFKQRTGLTPSEYRENA